jgi:hypothetical protein
MTPALLHILLPLSTGRGRLKKYRFKTAPQQERLDSSPAYVEEKTYERRRTDHVD